MTIEQAMELVRLRTSWNVEPLSEELQEALGAVVAAYRPTPPVPVWRCPECGEPVRAAGFVVHDDEGFEAEVTGFVCVECGRMGTVDDLPREPKWELRLWDRETLFAMARKAAKRRTPKNAGEERERLEAWARRRIEEALDAVRAAPPGARNLTLSQEAARVGRILARYPVMDEEEAIERLAQAAVEAGEDRRKALDTARRQVRWGASVGS